MSDVHDKVALRVILFLGSGMLLGLAGVILLVHESIQSSNQIDPSTVALVSGVSTLVGMGFGALGAILGRPSSGPTEPVPVTTQPGDVLATADVTAGANADVTIHPDAPEASDL